MPIKLAPRVRLVVELLEDRTAPAVIAVQANTNVRTVNDNVLGTNLAWWDMGLADPATRQLTRDIGLHAFRQPGGSSSDEWHFNVGPSYNGQGTVPRFNAFTEAMNAAGVVTTNYGTGSPQEAAAYLAYCNALPSSTLVIGNGPQWSDSAGAWVTKDWRTAGYWASLRAAAPLATDDGLNFLRANHPAPFGWKHWEVGNEVYGSWETDRHAVPHDPATYVTFSRQFAALAKQIDPTVKVGVVGSGTGGNYGSVGGNWTHEVLVRCAQQGFTPDFIADHNYMYDPGNENDDRLLRQTATNPNVSGYGGPINWVGRASAYRSMLQQDLGAAAANVELLCTEFNSVSYNPSNQTTSLVNGLWLADALGGILQTEYNMALMWDLRNGYSTTYYNPNLYGWRQGGDYGLLGQIGGQAPATGQYVPYPTYFAEQLVAKVIHTGDTVVRVTSDDTFLSAYGVRQQNGRLALLVVNKSPTADLVGQFTVTGFTPGGAVTQWQYGKAQDNTQRDSTDGRSALGQSSPALTFTPAGGGGTAFSHTFPSYSMTVLDLAPPPPAVANVRIHDGTDARSMVMSVTVTFNGTVTLPQNRADAFRLTRLGPGAPSGSPAGDVALAVDLSGSTATQTVARLTFLGTDLVGGSLNDGNYTLTVFGNQVSGPGGSLDGDGNGTPGGDHQTGLHRLFGDADGDRDVDNLDLLRLRSSFNLTSGLPGFLKAFDFENDDDVDNLDLLRLRQRFDVVLSPP